MSQKKKSLSTQSHDAESLLSVNRKLANTKCYKSKLFAICLTVIIVCVVIIAVGQFLLIKYVYDNNNTSCTNQHVAILNCTDFCSQNYSSYIQSQFDESTCWDETKSINYLKSFHSTDLGKCIVNMNVSNANIIRPDPTCYLPPIAIYNHLYPFRLYGASSIVPSRFAFGVNFTTIGRAPYGFDKNGVQYVSTYPIQSNLLTICSRTSDPADCVLNALGIPISPWDMFHYDWGNVTSNITNVSQVIINRVIQIYVSANNMKDLNVRIPSGNEAGTDSSEWRPGGYTINGTIEAVVNEISENQYCWTAVTLPNGTFCYPDCTVMCDDANGCNKTNCNYK